jgi:APA family basic amino acid/polyamine antiporter
VRRARGRAAPRPRARKPAAALKPPAAGRPLGFATAVALVVGHTIGVGVFLTPSETIGALASPALTLGLWLGGGALVLAGALTFGELAARHPESGGLYVFLREAWGERSAFVYGWQCLLVLDPGVTAALCAGLARYAAAAFPAAAGHERTVALAAVWILAVPPMLGLRPSVRALNILTVWKVLALLAVPTAAVLTGSGSLDHFRPFVERRPDALPPFPALAAGLVGVFYSFGGFWEASRLAGEVRNAKRTLPRALSLGTAVVLLLYLLTTAAFLYLVPADPALTATEFARRAGEALGSSGPAFLAGIVVLSAAASALALLLMAPRVYIAMSHDGLFPPGLAMIHPRTGAPTRATALLAVIASFFVLTGTFEQIVALFLCSMLVLIALAAAAIFVLRRRESGSPDFECPGYPFTPMVFIALLLAISALVAAAHPVPALVGFVLAALGLPAYRLLSARPNPRRHAP